MKPSYALIIVLIFFVFLKTGEAAPSDAIYLRDEDGFSPVEKVDYEGESRLYIRTMKSGVFLDERQSNNLIEAAYFHRIRESSPRSAAFSSLLMFDA
ncbi:MAG: hypothetical protein CVV45_17990, partial [Spirochaetae bacterium HGW-Spirochaetae-10]